jgi:hypothetical protein
VPTVASGRDVVVMPSTLIVNAAAACTGVASVKVIVKGNTPPAVGVPLMIPVAGSSVRPAGSEPEVTVHT